MDARRGKGVDKQNRRVDTRCLVAVSMFDGAEEEGTALHCTHKYIPYLPRITAHPHHCHGAEHAMVGRRGREGKA